MSSSTQVPIVVDEELRRAFEDLQNQVLVTREKVRKFQSEIDTVTRATAGMKITNKTLQYLEPQYRTFQSIGRTFVLRDRQTLAKNIDTMVKENEERIKNLEENKDKAKSRQSESENHIRELLTKKHYKA